MSRGRDQLGCAAHRDQVVPDEFGCPQSVGIVCRLGTNARDAQEGLELFLESVPMRVQISIHALNRHVR